MKPDGYLFLAGVVLLLFPVNLLHSKTVHYRPIAFTWDSHWRRVLKFWPHTVDLLRAALGSWLVFEFSPWFLGVAVGPGLHKAIIFPGVILLLSLSVQTLCRERGVLHAPFAFVTGMLFGVFSPTAAAVAFVLAVVVAFGSNHPALYFVILAASVAVAAPIFQGGEFFSLAVIFGASSVLPVLYALLFSLHLVVSYRGRPIDDNPDLKPS